MKAILARHFGGYPAVEAMSWWDVRHALQLLAEETVGKLIRRAGEEEDSQFSALQEAIRGA